MTVGSGLLVSRPCQQGHVADHVRKPCQQTTSIRTCGRPRQQGRVAEDHVSKYTWHNQMMTCVKKKLACAMSTRDVNKLRHSGRITSGVFTTRK
jgi:hypothetical protein